MASVRMWWGLGRWSEAKADEDRLRLVVGKLWVLRETKVA